MEGESGERPGISSRIIRPSFHKTRNSSRDRHLSNKRINLWTKVLQAGRDSVGTRGFTRSNPPDSLGQFFLSVQTPTSRGVRCLFLRRLRLLLLLIGKPAIFLVCRSREHSTDDLL